MLTVAATGSQLDNYLSEFAVLDRIPWLLTPARHRREIFEWKAISGYCVSCPIYE